MRKRDMIPGSTSVDPKTSPLLDIRASTLLTGFLAMLLACGEPAGSDDFIEHPIADSLSVDLDEAVLIRQEADPRSPVLEEFIERLEDRSVVARIGTFDGDPAYVFGEVADAHFLSDGSLAVLDGQADSVRVFDPQGNHRYSIGGAGEGPGELDFPVALVSPVDDELWIIDGAQMIHRFRQSDEGLVFENRVRVDGFPRDGCSGDGWIVLNVPSYAPGRRQAEILHLFDETATLQGSFAAPYRYTRRLVFDRMTRGSVACGDDRVILGFESLNRLDAYRAGDGRLLWHSSFEGIHMPPIQERMRPDGRRAIRSELPEGGPIHSLLGVAGGDETPLIVQYARRTAQDIRDRIDRYTVESFVVDPGTGEGSYLGEDLLQVLAMNDSQLAVVEVEPYPRIKVVELGPS